MQAKHNLPQFSSPDNGQKNNQLFFDENLIALDDLYRHGDLDAAALALGDTWQQLPPADRDKVVDLVKYLTGGNAR